MTGRHPHPHADGRYAPRTRSPPRPYLDRRSPIPPAAAVGARSIEALARPPLDASAAPPTTSPVARDPPPREAPRGPKALVDPTRGPALGAAPHVPAGPRVRAWERERDFRDARDPRDVRDIREPPLFRAERDRDRDRDRERPWRDRDLDRDRRFSPTHLRSPPPSSRDPRDLRDSRELRDPRDERDYGRDADLRGRKGSREAPFAATSPVLDSPITGQNPFGRGGFMRGRGRGDADYLARGRAGYPDERDRLYPRARSTDRRPERERDFDRRDDGRDDFRRIDREEREREAEKYKRERLSMSVDPRLGSGPSTNPPTPRSSTTTSPHPPSVDGRFPPDAARDPSSARRVSASAASAGPREPRRDGDKHDYLTARAEASRDRLGSRTSSPPPQAPQVPAFGSFAHRASSVSGPSSNVWRAPMSPHGATPLAPTGPRSMAGAQPPTAPKAERLLERAGAIRPDEPFDKDRAYTPRTPSTIAPAASPTKPLSEKQGPMTPYRPDGVDGLGLTLGTQSSIARVDDAPSVAANGPARSPSLSGAAKPADASRPTPFTASTSTSPTLGVHVPTGPRADRAGRGRSHQWIRGGLSYPNSRGSLTLRRNDNPGPERDRPLPSGRGGMRDGLGRGGTWAPRTPGSHNDGPHKPKDEGMREEMTDGRIKVEAEVNDGEGLSSRGPMAGRPVNPVASLGKAAPGLVMDWSDEDDDMDVDMETDMERQFDENEAQITTSLDGVRAKKATLEMEEATLLYRAITGLDEAAADLDLPLGEVGTDSRGGSASLDPSALPTPKDEEIAEVTVTEDDYAQANRALERDKTPALESLPFLTTGPPTPPPLMELDVVRANQERHHMIKRALAQVVAQERLVLAKEHEKLRAQYKQLYKPWRLHVEELDKAAQAQAQAQAESEQQAAPPEWSPPAALVSAMEGRRGGKFSTELELQLILKESELEAKEAHEARLKAEREAKAKVDTEKEAIIPEMLDGVQRDRTIFQDTNQLMDPEYALAIFRFVPPPDTFTAEEQKLFTENFLLYPKKWGKIAEALPDRDYKDCIEHYYQTKGEAKYKQKLNKRRTKKGRRAGPNAARPKSNALMSDLGVRPELYDGEEFDAPAAAVTDSGRPRRAAAPIFGEVANDADPGAGAATSGRKPPGLARMDAGAEAAAERGGKRGKTVGTREKGAKRGRNPLLAAAPGPSPQKGERGKEREGGKEREVKDEDDQRTRDLEDAQLLTSMQGRSTSIERLLTVTDDRLGRAPSASGTPPRDGTKTTRGGTRGATQTSSYWSVPECTEFPKLLDHFGTDWQAIASHMTSKTSVMVKNFFKREVEAAKPEWKERAELADAKRIRGEPMGPPPTPSALPKRRYDPPSVVSQPPLAPRVDTADVREMSPQVPAPRSVHSSPRQPTQPARYAPLAQAGTSQAVASPLRPTSMPARASQSHVDPPRASSLAQGPRSGWFQDTRADVELLQASKRVAQDLQYRQEMQQQQPQYDAPTMAPAVAPPTKALAAAAPASARPSSTAGSSQPPPQPNTPSTASLHSHLSYQSSSSRHPPSTSQHRAGTVPMQVEHRHEAPGSHHAAVRSGHGSGQPQLHLSVPRAAESYAYSTYAGSGSPALSPSGDRSKNGHPSSSSTMPTPAASRPAERKTSNIMDLLNSNEPDEPRARKRPRVSSLSTVSPSSQAPPGYQAQAPQPVHPGPRREPAMETHGSHASYQRSTSGELYGRPSQAPPRAVQEMMNNGSGGISPGGSGWPSRSYPTQVQSPPPPSPYGHHSRSSYSSMHAASSSSPSFGHSRVPSYGERTTPMQSHAPHPSQHQSAHPPPAPPSHQHSHQHQQPHPHAHQHQVQHSPPHPAAMAPRHAYGPGPGPEAAPPPSHGHGSQAVPPSHPHSRHQSTSTAHHRQPPPLQAPPAPA
ncbi:MAG: hypothetical protein M1838_003593, partial [Thelocarpon superellum]